MHMYMSKGQQKTVIRNRAEILQGPKHFLENVDKPFTLLQLGAIERSFFIFCIFLNAKRILAVCSKGTLIPNWDDVRTYVRMSHWTILFTPYLVVELSPSAEIWCVYVTSINDGAQILTFLGIHNTRDFQNSRFSVGI